MFEKYLPTLLTLVLLGGCSNKLENNDKPPADAGADLSTTSDAGSGDGADDAASEVDLGRCPGTEPCEFNERRMSDCSCLSNFDRKCFDGSDCRQGEECRDVDGTNVCWFEPPPVKVCPGTDGCDGSGDDVLLAAASTRSVTPLGFETPTEQGLDGVEVKRDPFQFLSEEAWNDCGLDGLCPGDEGYTEPDEGEADGVPQGVWIAGFSNGRAAQYCPPEKIGCDAADCCVSRFAHDDIEVNLVVFRQNDTTVAFAALDTIGFFHTDIERIRESVNEKVDVDLLVMGATHSHEGPDTSGQWGPGNPAPTSTGRDPRFFQRVTDQTVAGIEEAIAALEPANVAATVVDAGVDGLAISDSRTPYIFDDNLPIVHVTAADSGDTIATMFSWGNHAEVRWSDNVLLTSDYYGFARTYVEQGIEATTDVDTNEAKPALAGLGGVAVAFPGAVGGLINPGRGGGKDYAGNRYDGELDATWEATAAIGEQLASRVLIAIESGLTDLTPSLSFATKKFLVEAENRQLTLAAIALGLLVRDVYNVTRAGARFEPLQYPLVLTEVSVVRLGELTFFTAPGEVFPESLVGGYPNRPRVQNPVVGDVEERRVPATCDEQGLPTANDDGTYPCIVEKDQENPPDWDSAPEGPYAYERIPGDMPFFIGLGNDFLGYMVPTYDYEEVGFFTQAPGDHYEETNSIGSTIVPLWLENLQTCIDALPQ